MYLKGCVLKWETTVWNAETQEDFKCTRLENIYNYSTHNSSSNSSDWLKAFRDRANWSLAPNLLLKLSFMPRWSPVVQFFGPNRGFRCCLFLTLRITFACIQIVTTWEMVQVLQNLTPLKTHPRIFSTNVNTQSTIGQTVQIYWSSSLTHETQKQPTNRLSISVIIVFSAANPSPLTTIYNCNPCQYCLSFFTNWLSDRPSSPKTSDSKSTNRM